MVEIYGCVHHLAIIFLSQKYHHWARLIEYSPMVLYTLVQDEWVEWYKCYNNSSAHFGGVPTILDALELSRQGLSSNVILTHAHTVINSLHSHVSSGLSVRQRSQLSPNRYVCGLILIVSMRAFPRYYSRVLARPGREDMHVSFEAAATNHSSWMNVTHTAAIL